METVNGYLIAVLVKHLTLLDLDFLSLIFPDYKVPTSDPVATLTSISTEFQHGEEERLFNSRSPEVLDNSRLRLLEFDISYLLIARYNMKKLFNYT